MPSITPAKVEYEARVNRLLDTYNKVYFVGVDNVTSQQMHAIRRALRGKGELLMGKNTLQKKVIRNRCVKQDSSAADKALAEAFCERLIVGNCGLIFTNEKMSMVNDVIMNNRIQAPARVGAISPVEVVIPAGNTGMEPTMTSFFQALNIATKISKGTVEIMTDVKVLKVGDKVDTSTATLLTKLKILPFFYGLELRSVWDDGVVFTADDLKVTDEIIAGVFSQAIGNIAAVSLAAGIPTEASMPVLLVDAFKNLLAASIASDFDFEEFGAAQLKADIKSGKLAAAAPAAGGAAPAAAAAAPAKKVEEEEEDEDIGMGLFF